MAETLRSLPGQKWEPCLRPQRWSSTSDLDRQHAVEGTCRFGAWAPGDAPSFCASLGSLLHCVSEGRPACGVPRAPGAPGVPPRARPHARPNHGQGLWVRWAEDTRVPPGITVTERERHYYLAPRGQTPTWRIPFGNHLCGERATSTFRAQAVAGRRGKVLEVKPGTSERGNGIFPLLGRKRRCRPGSPVCGGLPRLALTRGAPEGLPAPRPAQERPLSACRRSHGDAKLKPSSVSVGHGWTDASVNVTPQCVLYRPVRKNRYSGIFQKNGTRMLMVRWRLLGSRWGRFQLPQGLFPHSGSSRWAGAGGVQNAGPIGRGQPAAPKVPAHMRGTCSVSASPPRLTSCVCGGEGEHVGTGPGSA